MYSTDTLLRASRIHARYGFESASLLPDNHSFHVNSCQFSVGDKMNDQVWWKMCEFSAEGGGCDDDDDHQGRISHFAFRISHSIQLLSCHRYLPSACTCLLTCVTPTRDWTSTTTCVGACVITHTHTHTHTTSYQCTTSHGFQPNTDVGIRGMLYVSFEYLDLFTYVCSVMSEYPSGLPLLDPVRGQTDFNLISILSQNSQSNMACGLYVCVGRRYGSGG